MDSTLFIYFGKADPPHSAWTLIEDTTEAREQAIQSGATAFSTVAFSHDPKDGATDPLRYGDLYLDFDDKLSPQNAIEDARCFVENLNINYGIEPLSLSYWVSGGKGCHLMVPAALFDGTDGDTHLPVIHKEMVTRLVKETEALYALTGTVDIAMYNMGKGRLLRIENIQRANGRYKVPVTYKEFTTLSYEDLFALTASPRTIQPRSVDYEQSEILVELFKEIQLAIHSPRYNVTKTAEVADKECAFFAHCRDNAATLPEPEWFAMLTNLAVLGPVGFQLAREYSRCYPKYSECELKSKLKHAFEQKPMTCASIKKLWDCGKNCNVACPYMLYQSKQVKGKGDGRFHLDEEGLFYQADPRDQSAKGQWICGPVEVVASTRDSANQSWGRLVRFKDAEKIGHQVIIPSSELAGTGDTVRQRLLDCGLRMSHDKSSKDLLVRYIAEFESQTFARMVKRFGWCGDVYVAYDATYGNKTGELFVPEFVNHGRSFSASGTLEEWKNAVATPCIDNPLLILAISYAFIGPLLTPCKVEGGGLHFFGPSSSGKTTVLKLAGSVCGGGGNNGFIQQWRATDNALESTAARHNDNLLCLDEIGQANSKVVSEVAYMLANGQGKARSNKEGHAKDIQEWRVAFMSTGELTLADKIAEDGRGEVKAGQAVRVLDIPADGGAGCGIFTLIPDGIDGATFSRRLCEAANTFYGTALGCFWEKLTQDFTHHLDRIDVGLAEFVRQFCPSKASGQVQRACRRFGLMAVAGELAIAFDILPWPKETALKAAKHGFDLWIKERGGSEEQESLLALTRVKVFFEKYADSKFITLDCSDSSSHIYGDPFGYRWKGKQDDWLYLVKSHVFQDEMCKGINRNSLLLILDGMGWLARTITGRVMETKTIPGKGNIRGIVFVPIRWEEAHKEECSSAPKPQSPHTVSEFDSRNFSSGDVF